MKKISRVGAISSIFILGIIVFFAKFSSFQSDLIVKGYTVITEGEFEVEAENQWDFSSERNYVSLNWEPPLNEELSQGGYRLYISGNLGASWESGSLNYGKEVKVLNVYPDDYRSNTLKGWMEKPDVGLGLVKVTSVTMSEFNRNQGKELVNDNGDFKYDVVVFGTWDTNNNKDLTEVTREEMQKFMESGRGVLFGHDTIWKSLPNFNEFKDELGITTWDVGINNTWGTELRMGSETVKIVNNGYLMKYPHELANNLELKIPFTHSAAQMSGIDTNTKWLEFVGPFGQTSAGRNGTEVKDDEYGTNNFYLLTKGNLGIIQTGHSNGTSTPDEMKILVNTLYNLAQVSFDSSTNNYSVEDDVVPNAPTLEAIGDGAFDNFSIQINGKDDGKNYQFYVEAEYKKAGVLKSDVVEEEVKSNIAGYFYKIIDEGENPDTFIKEIEGLKDEYGRISFEKYPEGLYVAPRDQTSLVEYDTGAELTLNGNDINFSGYNNPQLVVVAVDRANNIGEPTISSLQDFMSEIQVVETYKTIDGKMIQPNTFEIIKKESYSYQKKFPMVESFIPLTYEFRNPVGEMSSINYDDNNPNIDLTSLNSDLLAFPFVNYLYGEYVNIHVRQVVLSKDDSIALPKKGKVEIQSDIYKKEIYSINTGYEDTEYSSLLIENFNLTSEGVTRPITELYLKLIESSLYRYKGSVVTKEDVKHDSSNMSMSDVVLDLLNYGDSSEEKEYWVTIYIEPTGSNEVYLNVVNGKLNVYYSNINEFSVFLDGKLYEKYQVNNNPTVEKFVLDIPVSDTRNKVTVEYENGSGDRMEVYWNNNWSFVNDIE